MWRVNTCGLDGDDREKATRATGICNAALINTVFMSKKTRPARAFF